MTRYRTIKKNENNANEDLPSVTDAAAAHEAGKQHGREWAGEQQQGFDLRWLDPDTEFVEVSLYDLSFALRDRAYDACMDEYTDAFIEGARSFFKEVDDQTTGKDESM